MADLSARLATASTLRRLPLTSDIAPPRISFSIGSSGVESALAAQWQAAAPAAASALAPADQPLLVIAGSCSPVTAEQIDHALQNGFAEAPLDVVMEAGRLTLLDRTSLDRLLPTAAARGIGVLAAAVFNSGILVDPVGSPFFDFVAPETVARDLAGVEPKGTPAKGRERAPT